VTTERRGSAARPGSGSPADGAEPQLPDTPDSLIFAGVGEQLAAALAARPDDDEEDEEGLEGEPSEDDSDEFDDDSVDEDEGEQPGARDPEASAQQPPKPKAPRRTAEEWGKTLAAEGLQHISQIPNALLRTPALLEAYGNERARAAAERTQATIAENLRHEDNLRRFVAEVDDHFADDPDGLLAWIKADPQGPVYANAQQYLAQSQQRTPEERVGAAAAAEALNERATRQYSRLGRFPDLQAELVRRQQEEKKYPATSEGMAQLERDVDELLEQGLSTAAGSARGNGAGPAGQPPERRRPARPLVSPGSSGAPARRGAPDVSNTNDPDELVSMGVTQGLRQLGRGR